MTLIEIYVNAEMMKVYSDRDVLIEQVETGKKFPSIITQINDGYHYRETDIPVIQNEDKKEVEK